MFADDEGVHIAAVYLQILTDQILEPCGVQHGSRTDDPAGGQSGQFLCQIGEQIDRIGHHEQDTVGCDGKHGIQNAL